MNTAIAAICYLAIIVTSLLLAYVLLIGAENPSPAAVCTVQVWAVLGHIVFSIRRKLDGRD